MNPNGGNTLAFGTHDNGERRWTRWRIVFWTAAALVLLAPLVAMQFTEEVNWTASDFAFAGALLLGVGVAYEAAMRQGGGAAHRWAMRLALGAGFLLVWTNGAVGIIGSEANEVNLLYYGVLAVGAAGVVLARFRPRGMAVAMAATALGQASVAVGALVAGAGAPENGPVEIVVVNALFVVLWLASAALFRRAADAERGAPRIVPANG